MRTIMLIPGGNSIGLTSMSITLVKLFKKKGYRILFFKLLYEINNLYNIIDDTSYLLKKYYAIDCISYTTKKFFFTQKLYDKNFIENNLKLYYKYKNNYDIILIEGIKSSNYNHCICDINFKFFQHINAELIFYLSNNYHIEDCLKNIDIYKKKYIQYKILNIIINDIYFNIKNIYFHSSNQRYLKKYFIPSDLKNIILKISINKNLLNFFIKNIFNNLKIYTKLHHNHNLYLIHRFVLYNCIFLKKYKYCHKNIIVIIPINIKFSKICNKLNNILKNFNPHSILFTNICIKYIHIVNILQKKLNITIPIFCTYLDCFKVIIILKKYRFLFYKIKKYQLDYIINILKKFINIYDSFNVITHHNNNANIVISSIFFKKYVIEKAQKIYKCILLPEGENIKIIQAASIVSNLKIAKCILLGDPNKINTIIKKEKISFCNNIQIINPENIKKKYIETLFLLRYKKGMTQDIARMQVNDNMILGTLMLYKKQVDGLVCGINYTSADVLRPALQLIGTKYYTKNNSSLVSSIFFMLFENCVVIYGDCAMNISPNSEQLSEIAITAADLAKKFFIIPRIAMLSYSTGTSGIGETVDKVKQATLLVKQKRPDLIIDGPIQYDAAVNILIAQIKSPHSPLQGFANIFIFPDLNSGNITYKAIQQAAKIISIGPILQGLKQPVNDLSRGANINDIMYTIAITAIQSDDIKI